MTLKTELPTIMESTIDQILSLETLTQSSDDKTFFDCFIFGNGGNTLLDITLPRRVEGGGFMICLKGECEVSIDQVNYRLHRGDMCLVFHSTLVQAISSSDDFKGYAMAFDNTFMQNLTVLTAAESYLYMRDNPCIPLIDKQMHIIIRLSHWMKERMTDIKHPYHSEIAHSLAQTICYEIMGAYVTGKPIPKQVHSSEKRLLQRFLFELSEHGRTNRSVGYYAQRLCISQKYLSTAIKKASGVGASEWIVRTAILNIKTLLISTDFSVREIAQQLHFANPSFLTQYFKRNTGKTPQEFRRMNR